ncbi:YfhJ family protein [Anaerobacillus sp. MEB173]|uniref:YfhJ family protein n=1 Tax=Anaerobacillus sp. MEB173 TaxID=3383345 RepID=UPI003F91F74F
MNDRFNRLAATLLEYNDQLSYGQALSWVESMWEDYEATYAKAGREYRDIKETEKMILDWIQIYGPHLHEIVSLNPKFAHLLEDNYLKH